MYGYVISGFVFFTFELVALFCGIPRRHTASGKTGLVISAGVLSLVLLFELYSFIRFVVIGDRPPMQSPPPPRKAIQNHLPAAAQRSLMK